MKNVRNITFELCAWGFGNVETFGASFGHLWRTSMDVKVRFEVVTVQSHRVPVNNGVMSGHLGAAPVEH